MAKPSFKVKSIKSTTQLKTIASWPQVINSCDYNDTLRHSRLQCDANYSRGLDVLNAQLSAVFKVRDSTASKQQVCVENISTAWFIKKAHSVLKSRGGRLCGFIVHCTATAVGSLILVCRWTVWLVLTGNRGEKALSLYVSHCNGGRSFSFVSNRKRSAARVGWVGIGTMGLRGKGEVSDVRLLSIAVLNGSVWRQTP